MKAVVLASTTSAKSTTAAAATSASVEETRDSCYYPGCRKDANCDCEMCLASINATLDLMPFSIQKSSLTKLSTASRPNPKVEVTPISFSSSIMSTPTSNATTPIPMSPGLRSSARTNLKEKKIRKRERKWGCGSDFLRLFGVLSLFFVAEFGFSWMVSGVLRPVFSPVTVRSVGEKSWAVRDLNGKVRFLQKSLQGLVDGKISNCSYANSRWEIGQDGLLLSSHCKLYQSSMEEIRIWGWPLQTAGLLTTGFSSRSFTVISGRVTEWSDGKVGYVIRKANSSWAHRKWASSAVQFDPNTWILEYRQSSILENPRLFSAIPAFLKYRASRIFGQMKQDLWLFSAFESYQHYKFAAKSSVQVPT
ncbi:ERG2/sigma1 receptor-like [Parasponia andersonii]|uniref:ERG2/sigma1 receptor-like n=1 Tax=Parasponia andersonii TaxID=3476 RepID=A0A2P5E3C3_PARAD|nr:ERG2/sigma1 receptor-like [Parasponia andersonii]